MARKTECATLLVCGALVCSTSFACDEFDTSDYVLPEPVIQVAPDDNDDGIESCVVVAFRLVEKEGTDGHALLATDSNAIFQTSDVTEERVEFMERAVEKFLFFTRAHEDWADTTYYWVFRY